MNIPVVIAKNEAQLSHAEKIILPGVGSFDWAISRLNASGMRECLDELVVECKIPVLGVCVGMQMMAAGSDEGKLQGLGWIDARVMHLHSIGDQGSLPLPHMGWNDVSPVTSDCLFKGIVDPRYYFLHSYYFEATNDRDVLATTVYGERFASAVRVGNIFGTQFHPEKSHQWGIQLLKNFAEL
jgi:glutamine amidotransferase